MRLLTAVRNQRKFRWDVFVEKVLYLVTVTGIVLFIMAADSI